MKLRTFIWKSREQMNIDMFEKCIEIVDKCLAYAKMSKTEVDKIMLVGGTTQM